MPAIAAAPLAAPTMAAHPHLRPSCRCAFRGANGCGCCVGLRSWHRRNGGGKYAEDALQAAGGFVLAAAAVATHRCHLLTKSYCGRLPPLVVQAVWKRAATARYPAWNQAVMRSCGTALSASHRRPRAPCSQPNNHEICVPIHSAFSHHYWGAL